MDVKLILEEIAKNISRQNQFQCFIPVPNLSELSAYSNNEFITKMGIYITNASIPSQNLTLTETKYLNKVKWTITGKDVDNINITFYDTKEQIIRNMFITWADAITTNSKHTILKYYPSDYKVDIKISIHEKSTYSLVKCAPISIGDFVLDMTNESTIGTFSVTFKVSALEIL